MAAAESLKAIQGLSWNTLFQPLPSSMLTNKGPNVSGIDASESPLVNLPRNPQSIIAEATAEVKRLDLWHPFIYLPYAAAWQDPIGSYGRENVEFLRWVSRKYDSRGVVPEVGTGRT
ncbi:hypothetical protein H2201_006758 [Coniosporium apollinis]|uniref:Uncharacterized protein n=1 Tax=Coniosporium apollinis TaxID=61459 RepID=A0ABQ9NSQ0_9PEZI|nr:hypothetical protein H2201_006758 [Coniosporium apollinis]